MTVSHQPLISPAYLRAVFENEFRAFKGSVDEKALIERIEKWSKKTFQKEKTAEIAFVNVYFETTWGYTQSGKTSSKSGFSCHPKYPVPGAGQTGGSGEADAALGYFGRPGVPSTPQVMCEFKDVRSNLDAPQKRKGNNRSPVKQCGDYLREAMKPLYGNEAIQPTWGIVTDMNEFRLYWRNTMPSQYQRFIINRPTTDEGVSLLDESEAGSFERFLFVKLFHADSLLTAGGPSALLKLLRDQRYRDREIENIFYREYRAYRERLVQLLFDKNPTFPGTKGRLVRLAQKLIDRCLFVMFCEDMGQRLSFPPNALRDYLSELSKQPVFQPDEEDAWNKLKELFRAMNEGKRIFGVDINRFNGGLFAADAELEGLVIPNSAFCSKNQGDSDTTLKADPLTLLYFAGSYNFGTTGREGKAITLYTLGRIFEQSITELEVLEAQADDKPSLTVISKRKRDGVYYTPEWVVERIVAETLGSRLDEIREQVGWSFEIEGDDAVVKAQVSLAPSKQSAAFKKHVEGVRAFRDRLDSFTVLDPACGSGAFLIHALEYLLRERRRVQRELARVSGGKQESLFEFKADEEVRAILSKNIFGVDINPASVEIARLALWLHTAKSDQPLSNLETNILEGNSLVGSEVYDFKKDLLTASAAKKETINAFDYEARFPTVFDSKRPGGSGFDCVVGNPPYVKLQNFRKVYPETAEFLRKASGAGGHPRFKSCQTGNFDLYLPFIERSLELLSPNGRLGFIAPSLWRYNEYGEGLRKLLHSGSHLDRWIDFDSYQVFEEAVIYTALQFYSRAPCDRVRFALAPTGELARLHDWDDPNWYVTYAELPKNDSWILVPRHERALLNKLSKNCRRLDDRAISRAIFQGLITSADHIYHLERIGANRYRYQPPKGEGAKEKPPAEEVPVEDAIMHPLVAGPEVHRYQNPLTNTYILFPYAVADGQIGLIPSSDLAARFPLAWAHLKRFEKLLRARENKSFDDSQWYRFGRHQGIDKQEKSKILIPRLCLDLAAVYDAKGEFYTDNVDVGGIELASGVDAHFITGLLNCSTLNFVWKRIAKPFQNGYRSANKQFIAPLPIPAAKAEEIEKVATLAKRLSNLHTERRDALRDISRRFDACSTEEKPEEWLWPAVVRDINELKKGAPKALSAKQKTAWAKAERQVQIAQALQTLSDSIRVGAELSPSLAKGELRIKNGSVTILDGVFVDSPEGEQVLMNWRHFLRTTPITEGVRGPEIARGLRNVRISSSAAVTKQIAALDAELSKLEAEIRAIEDKLNSLAYRLYGLTLQECKIVESS